jgi:hypothetical protein
MEKLTQGLQNLYLSPNIIRVIKPRRTRQAGHATHMMKVTVEWLALYFLRRRCSVSSLAQRLAIMITIIHDHYFQNTSNQSFTNHIIISMIHNTSNKPRINLTHCDMMTESRNKLTKINVHC